MSARVGKFVKSAFTNYPMSTNSLVYGTLYVAAEFSQQTLSGKVFTRLPKDYDKKAIVRYGITGAFIYSPILTTWYKWLDRKFVGTTYKIIAKKLFLDQFLLTPPLIGTFFVAMSLMERKSDVFEECRVKLLPTFEKSCMFWIPAQAINFLIVPPTFRVAYVATCAFAWVNILCYVKREEY